MHANATYAMQSPIAIPQSPVESNRHIGRSRYLIAMMGGFVIGVLFAPDFQGVRVEILVALGITVFMLFCIWRRLVILVLFVTGCIGIVLGIARYQLAEVVITPGHIAYYNDDSPIHFIGTVIREPDVRLDQQKLTVETNYISTGTEWKEIHGKVLISTGKFIDFPLNARLEVYGTVETPAELSGFSYGDYLRRYDIYSVSYTPELSIVGKSSARPIRRLLVQWKQSLEYFYSETFHEPYASFMSGLLLGSRRGLPQQVQDNLQATGLTHIIAISGYNITLIIIAVGVLLNRFGRNRQIIVSTVFIILFTILVGASAAVVRAAIMGILGLMALRFERSSDILIGVVVTAAGMLAVNPYIGRYDVGFQLSFSALIGLIYISPLMTRTFRFLPGWLGLRESLVATMSAQIASTPIILYHFHRVSMVAPLANVLVAPAVPASMLGGFLVSLTYFLPDILRQVVGIFAWAPMAYILGIVRLLGDLPMSSRGDIAWGIGASVLWYFVVIISCMWFHRSRVELRK